MHIINKYIICCTIFICFVLKYFSKEGCDLYLLFSAINLNFVKCFVKVLSYRLRKHIHRTCTVNLGKLYIFSIKCNSDKALVVVEVLCFICSLYKKKLWFITCPSRNNVPYFSSKSVILKFYKYVDCLYNLFLAGHKYFFLFICRCHFHIIQHFFSGLKNICFTFKV